jgi:TusA-related sulfurtransferase
MCSTPKGGLVIRQPTPVKEDFAQDDNNFHATFRASNENVERLQQQRIRAFEAQEPEYQQTLEIDRIRCPAHILQLTQTLKQLPHHHTLKVISHSASLIHDLAASARILHYPTQTLKFRSQHFLYVKPATG